MNPWGLLILALGVVLVIIAVKGNQRQAIAAIRGVPPGTAAAGAAQLPHTSSSASPAVATGAPGMMT